MFFKCKCWNCKMKCLKKIAKLLTIVGALNWGSVALLNVDLVKTLIKNESLQRGVYILVAISGLVLLYMMINWYLNPKKYKCRYKMLFSESILPSLLIQGNELEGENVNEMEIKTLPNKKIIYWAALQDEGENQDSVENILDHNKAYGAGTNSGITMSDNDGKAVLKYRMPQGYKVKDKVLKPHLHYRVVKDDMILGEIMTIEL